MYIYHMYIYISYVYIYIICIYIYMLYVNVEGKVKCFGIPRVPYVFCRGSIHRYIPYLTQGIRHGMQDTATAAAEKFLGSTDPPARNRPLTLW